MSEKRWEPGCTFSSELTGFADKVDVVSGMPPEVRTGTVPLISGFILVCMGGRGAVNWKARDICAQEIRSWP